MLDRILVPLDRSDTARAAVNYAAAIPSRSVTLLSVLPDTTATGASVWAVDQAEWRQKTEIVVKQFLQEIAGTLEAQGRFVDIVVVHGDPAERILSYSANADLIVMTTHGLGAGKRLLFGSVADRIARHAPVPVMLIRGGDLPVEPRPIQRIVTPLDGSDLAERALPLATDLADTLGVPLLLVQALDHARIVETAHPAGSPVAPYSSSMDVVLGEATTYLEEHAQLLRNRSLQVDIAVLEGGPVDIILDILQAGDLLVMTSHGRGGIKRWFLGSVAEKLVREAPAPILLYRSSDASS
jgi:nucleotide-binding universal stress UspA family protein